MELSKTIPSRNKKVKFKWAYKFFMECTEGYLEIRGKYKRHGKVTMCKCDWCGHEFEIGEWFGLAQPLPKQEGPKRNWALCHDCCDLMRAPINPRNANQKIQQS